MNSIGVQVRGEKIMTVATASIAQINTPTEVLIYRRVFSGMLNARFVTFFVGIVLLDEKNKAEATEFESPSGPWVLLAAVCVKSPLWLKVQLRGPTLGSQIRAT
jgi:hypothetical protein